MQNDTTFQLSETQILKIIQISREGSYFIDYSKDPNRPYAGKDYYLEPEEIVEEIKRGNIE